MPAVALLKILQLNENIFSFTGLALCAHLLNDCRWSRHNYSTEMGNSVGIKQKEMMQKKKQKTVTVREPFFFSNYFNSITVKPKVIKMISKKIL